MRKILQVLLLLSAIAALSCQNTMNSEPDPEAGPDEDKILLRVRNDNIFDVENMTINDRSFGDLSPDQISRFIAYDEIANNTLRMSFIDDGEQIHLDTALDSILSPGFYTLQLRKIHSGEFIRDVWFSFGFNDPDHIDKPQKANIRLINESDFDLENVVIDLVNFGDLKKGEITQYKFFDLVYNNAYVEFYIGDEFVSRQPVDHVGEIPLAAGFYTFKLDVNLEHNFAILDVVED